MAVRDGIVTLTGTLDPATGAHGDLIPVAVRLMWDVDGVVDVIDRLGQPLPVTHPGPRRPHRQAEAQTSRCQPGPFAATRSGLGRHGMRKQRPGKGAGTVFTERPER